MADKSRQTSANTRSRTPIANGHDPDAVLPKLQERSEDSNDDLRPVIQLFSGKLSAAADEAAALLAAAGVELYRRGGTLVRPVIQSTARPAKGSPDSLALVLVSRASLLDTLSRHIRFDRYNGKSGVWVPVNPPQQLAEILLAREGEWPFPPIAGVLTAPTLRPDGSLLAEAGYDPATRFYVFNPHALGPMPENPTRADAEAALALLLDLLVEFPFTSEAGRSVALSLLITPLVRSMMTTAPLHCVVAPEAGTGKSYLVDTAAAALLGYRCPVFSASTREEETEKRLAGSLIDGRPMISIDNVNGVLRGDLLCQAIVRPVVDVRPLGTSRKVRVENHATFVATGNNLRLEGDLTRRAILCYLDAGAARPELRAFTQSPFDEILQDRGHVIAAALTLVRAYICSGSPNPAPRLASFEEWSDTVRSALIWLGCADPVETMELGRADDPVRETFELFVAACRERYGERPFRAAELMQDAQAGHGGAPAYPSLHEAVFGIAHTGQRLDPSVLAYWLRSHKGKVAEGYKLTNDGKKQANWRVVPLNRAQGMRASGAWRPES